MAILLRKLIISSLVGAVAVALANLHGYGLLASVLIYWAAGNAALILIVALPLVKSNLEEVDRASAPVRNEQTA